MAELKKPIEEGIFIVIDGYKVPLRAEFDDLKGEVVGCMSFYLLNEEDLEDRVHFTRKKYGLQFRLDSFLEAVQAFRNTLDKMEERNQWFCPGFNDEPIRTVVMK